MSGGKGDAQGRGNVDDHGGSCLGSEAVHGLEFNHFVTHGANDAPAAGGRTRCHDDGAGDDHPLIDDEFRSAQKSQPVRQILKGARFCAGEEREGDDAHRFLRIIGTMAVRHEASAYQLQLAKYSIHDARPEAVHQHGEQKHQHRPAEESNERGGEHGQNHFGPKAGGGSLGISRRPVHYVPVAIS